MTSPMKELVTACGLAWGAVAAVMGFYTIQDAIRINKANKNRDTMDAMYTPYTYLMKKEFEQERIEREQRDKAEYKKID